MIRFPVPVPVPRLRRRLRSRAAAMIATVLLGLSVAGPAAAARGDASIAEDWRAAGEAYRAGRHDVALTLYEGIHLAGWRNGDLYYNLGNTYLSTGQTGEAIRAYLRAQRFRPRDGDIEHNLEIARMRIVAQTDVTGWGHALRSLAFWYDLLTYRELAWAVVGAWCLSLTLLAVRRHVQAGWTGGAAAAGLGVLAVLVGTLAVKGWEAEHVRAAVVLEESTPLRRDPSMSSESLAVLSEGVEVRLLGAQGAYDEVRTTDGGQGWVRSDRLGPVATEPGA